MLLFLNPLNLFNQNLQLILLPLFHIPQSIQHNIPLNFLQIQFTNLNSQLLYLILHITMRIQWIILLNTFKLRYFLLTLINFIDKLLPKLILSSCNLAFFLIFIYNFVYCILWIMIVASV